MAPVQPNLIVHWEKAGLFFCRFASGLPQIELKLTRDFLITEASAREFRAIASMFKDGILPIEVVYSYMRNAGVIPSWINEERFKELLKSQASFPAHLTFKPAKSGSLMRRHSVKLGGFSISNRKSEIDN